MTIAVFKKVTLFGLSRNKASILERLQEMGCMHLIASNQQQVLDLTTPATTLVDQIKKALLYLQDSPQYGRQKLIDRNFDADKTVEAVLENQKLLRDAIDRHDFLQQRIKDLSVWGNFKLPKKGEIGDIKFWFYKLKYKDLANIVKDLVVQEVHRDNLFIYVIVMSPEEPSPSTVPTARVHTGSVSLTDLQQEMNETIEKIDDLNESRQHLARYRKLLKRELANFSDRTALQQAGQQIYEHKDFFHLQGWIPQKDLPKIKTFCKENEISMIAEPAALNELPPTLLETYQWANGGIELVNFYQTPSYHTLDPSMMVFFSFSVFFAMILADAGYGLIIALFTLLGWKWLGKFNAGVWLRPLLITISIFSIVYGVIIGGYFGAHPPANTILAKLQLLNINNFNTMMKTVITVGCLHIVAANVMRAWFAKTLSNKMQAAGYIILIIGGMLLAWGLINHTKSATIMSIFIMSVSVLILMTFGSDLPITDFKSFVKRGLHGLEALTHLTSLFGDILSYLRLFALGLAGASLAITFNQIAAKIAVSSLHGHGGWVLAFLVLLLGQTLNFAICVMSAVIHGLRLNYIEFFKWSVKEEGYVYTPLKKTGASHE